MSYSIISVGQEKADPLEIKNEAVSSFLKAERNIFSGKLSELPAGAAKDVEALVGRTERLGWVRAFAVFALAGERKRNDIRQFVRHCQEMYSTEYFVGK